MKKFIKTKYFFYSFYWNYWQFYNIATMIICYLKKNYKMWKCLQCGLWLLFIPYLFLLQCLIYILHWLWIVLKIVFCPWYRLHFDNFFHSFVFALLCYFSLKKIFHNSLGLSYRHCLACRQNQANLQLAISNFFSRVSHKNTEYRMQWVFLTNM